MGAGRRRTRVRSFAGCLAVAALVVACGSSDDATESSDPVGGDDAATTTTEAIAPAPPSTPVDTDGSEPDDTVAEIEYGGVVVMGLEAEATGLRPWEDPCSSSCYNLLRTIYDPLFQINADGAYAPYLAEEIAPNEDFTVWTMRLRPDVTFHNGVALTAQTIVDMFAIQQTGAVSSGVVSSSKLASVAALDDLTVEYTLSAPNSTFPATLVTGPLGFAFEPAAASSDPAGYATAPIGTGPFVIAGRDIDNETTVVRNESYWRADADGNQLPYLDSIVFRPIPDEGIRLDALLSGTVDMIQSLKQAGIRDARAEDGIVLYEFQGNEVSGGMFNTARPPFDDVRVRLGLNKLNDQDRVIEALGGSGIAAPGTQWFSPDSPWWTQAAADSYPTFDFEGGTALLQEYIDDPERSDGKAPGELIDVQLACPPDPTLVAAMQVIQQVWAGSGLVNVELVSFDQAAHINAALSDQHQAHCWRFASQSDPSAFLNPFLAPPTEEIAAAAGIPGVVSPANAANWWDPEAYEWAVAASATDDTEVRKDLFSRIMVRMNEQAPVWYSGHTPSMVATEPNIRGIDTWTFPDGSRGNGTPSAEVRFQEVYLSDE